MRQLDVKRFIFFLIVPLLAFPVSSVCAQVAPWEPDAAPLAAGEVLVASPDGFQRDSLESVEKQGLVVVDLSDTWAPFIFSEQDPGGKIIKKNPYRETFIALANDRTTQDETFLHSASGRAAILGTVPPELRSTEPGELSVAEQEALARAERGLAAERPPNFLEVYGIPPTLSVLAKRVAEDSAKTCWTDPDPDALHGLEFEIGYQTREQAKKDYAEANEDAVWAAEKLQGLGIDTMPTTAEGVVARLLEAEPTIDQSRLGRYRRGQMRLRAVHAVQRRLVCEGLLSPDRFAPGVFDHPTHSALADFEKKNDIFGWGFVSGETRDALLRPPIEMHFETLKRIFAERVADAAGILEDGSVSRGDEPVTFVNASGETVPVPNLIGDFVDQLMRVMGLDGPDAMTALLAAISARGSYDLRVAYQAPPLPPYYSRYMDLAGEIDRGDIWYDVPFDAGGKPLTQRRRRYPSFTLYVNWRNQKIPLVHWRTTIGSWRSELASDGHVYLKYKNSDVGPRIWKNIIAAPVWVPPDSTPGKDLIVKKVFDRKVGPVPVVNTEVMGPGFASAYGLVMAIHLKELEGGGLFDNQIRTHGSVDYTSIARRFSHGCHRLVNNRAVRLFDFVLKHRKFVRLGNRSLPKDKRKVAYQGRRFEYVLPTRGYYYDLRPPVPVTTLEGRVLGEAKAPIKQMVRKPGVDYGTPSLDSAIEMQPVVGP